MPETVTKTLKVRVRDKHAKLLSKWAVSVNQVWNYCNELSFRSITERRKWLSGYDLQSYTKGASELGLNSATLQMVGHEYVTRRKQVKKTKLQWRKSFGARRSLGWIPVRKDCFSIKSGQIYHNRHHFKIWDSYGLSKYKTRAASFNEDARGRWYFNVVVEVPVEQSAGTGAVGIDLGCKDAATCSNGEKLAGRWYRAMEEKLAVAQRAGKKDRVRAIHAKIANRRKDALHKFSRNLVNQNAAIFVGNVNARAITQTKLAKSSLDAGWSQLRTMLSYKSDHAGIVYEEINEAYTTQACSRCGAISSSSPKGRAGLGIRQWICVECGTLHDRDINAAKNIAALGHGRLAGGIAFQSREA